MKKTKIDVKILKPELLLPAKNPSVFKTAVMYGADAVYIGGEAFSLRAQADNFSISDIKDCVKFAHENGVRVYVAANIFARNSDLSGIKIFLNELRGLSVDAVLISDPGVLKIAREIIPDIEIHVSTQANNTNYAAYNFWYNQGAKRAVAARELSLKEIAEIRENIPEDMEIEAFVHGSMCISYSGRCLLSAYLTGRSANKGDCSHPCRWKYVLEEETRSGEYFPIEEDGFGTYILNSKDLCMIDHIPDLVFSGINSFKIEGRMKSSLYVASIGRAYRKAIDDFFAGPEKYAENQNFYREEILKCTYREYTTGFFYERPDETAQIYGESTYVKNWVFLGEISDDSIEESGGVYYGITQKNKFSVGDDVEIMLPVRGFEGDLPLNIFAKVSDMRDEEFNPITSCPHAKEHIYVCLGEKLPLYSIIRKEL